MECGSHAQFVTAREWSRSEEKQRHVRIVKEAGVPLKASFLALNVEVKGLFKKEANLWIIYQVE
jgi:hypothetical protein